MMIEHAVPRSRYAPDVFGGLVGPAVVVLWYGLTLTLLTNISPSSVDMLVQAILAVLAAAAAAWARMKGRLGRRTLLTAVVAGVTTAAGALLGVDSSPGGSVGDVLLLWLGLLLWAVVFVVTGVRLLTLRSIREASRK